MSLSHSGGSLGRLVICAFLAWFASAACSAEEAVPGRTEPDDVSQMLAEEPQGLTEVSGDFFAETSEAADGTRSTTVLLCDSVRLVEDVPDVPPMECRGGSVVVQPTVADLDLGWSATASGDFTDRLLVRGQLRDGEFVLAEIEFDGLIVAVP